MPNSNLNKRYKKTKKEKEIVLQNTNEKSLKTHYKVLIIVVLTVLCIGAIIGIVFLTI